MGIPELWALVLLAFVTVGFVSTKNWIRSIIAIVLGITLGLVGVDVNNVPRFTLGWRYLEDGIQLLPFVAGLFAIPELLSSWKRGDATNDVEYWYSGTWKQITQGIKDVFTSWKDSIRGTRTY